MDASTTEPLSSPEVKPGGRWRWRALAALLLLGATAAHFAYLVGGCPLDLAPDEAHYWDWSRHLDWSYYSKGPLVAFLIRGSCELFGPLSVRLVGSEMLAVRLPAVVCGTLLLLAVYLLTALVYRNERLALGAVALALPLPVLAAGSSLMTIDAPYACCWAWALVTGYLAVFREQGWAWVATGILIGIGILAKYTMVLWVPSLGLFLLLTPGYRRLLARPGFWIMAAVGAAFCLPILVWNVQHDWVSLRHVGGQAGVKNLGLRWLGPLEYVGVQAGVLLGFWFVAWVAALVAYRPTRGRQAGVAYLWWLSVPMFAFFGVFSLKTVIEPNWPVTAYLSGLILAAAWVAERLRSPVPRVRALALAGTATGLTLGLVVTLLAHRMDLAQPLLLRVSGPATAHRPVPLRRFDPTCRLRGWRELAAEVDAVRQRVSASGEEPLIFGSSWTLPGELGFYCQGHPQAYSIGLALGERHSQYDLWHPNPVRDPESFRGRTVIFVGDPNPLLLQVFDRVETPEAFVYRERGEPVARWMITVCRGFRGFPPLPWLQEGARY